MKHLFFISALLVIMVSCKKEMSQNSDSFLSLQSIKRQLKDSLSAADFQQLNFDNAVSTSIPKSVLIFLRVPFLNKNIQTDFILLKIKNDNSFSAGKIFNITKNTLNTQHKTATVFNGNIQILSLKRNLLTTSTITNGYVDAFRIKQSDPLSKAEIAEVPLMPEVVIMCNMPSTGGDQYFSNYYNLESFFNGGVSGNGGDIGDNGSTSNATQGNGSYYSNSNPNNSGPGAPHPGGSGYTVPADDDPVLIDFETGENLAAINLDQYIKCFSSIPDAGAVCSIKILTDIPVDNDPTQFFDWKNNSPGHTFLQISKKNGAQSLQQNIGFYPTTDWKIVLTSAPVDGKFVDNAEHEFNASLLMSLTPEQLQGVFVHMQYLERFIKYDIDDYNCTDFALEIFNYKRGGNQLTIPMYDIPGGTAPNGTATPQGLYQQLKIMKEAGGSESDNITFPGVKGFAGDSHGPCN